MVNIQYKLVNHTNTGSNNTIKLLPHLQKEGHSVLESKCPQKKPSSSKLQSISSPSASRWHSILINHLAGSPSLPVLAFWSSELQTLHLSSLSSHAAAAAESLHSCPTLCDTMDCSPPGSSVCGILPARMLEWITMTSSRGSSQLRDQPGSSALQSDSLPLSHTEALPCCYRISNASPAVTETKQSAGLYNLHS